MLLTKDEVIAGCNCDKESVMFAVSDKDFAKKIHTVQFIGINSVNCEFVYAVTVKAGPNDVSMHFVQLMYCTVDGNSVLTEA